MSEEKKEVKQIKVEIPTKVAEKIIELQTKKQNLSRMFYQVSIQNEVIAERVSDTFKKMRNVDEGIGQKIKFAFDKLKLKKRKNYRWQYDGKGQVFIGTEVPEPKVEEKK